MEANNPPGHEKYRLVLAMAQRQPAIATAVVHPCDEVSLSGAMQAHRLGLIAATLVAPEARLRALAAKSGIDISGVPIVASSHSHDSADKAVALVRAGKVEALMKGSLHTEELMGAVVANDTGLRTERRISPAGRPPWLRRRHRGRRR